MILRAQLFFRVPLDQPLRQHHHPEGLRPFRNDIPHHLAPFRFRFMWIYSATQQAPVTTRKMLSECFCIFPQRRSSQSLGGFRLSFEPFS